MNIKELLVALVDGKKVRRNYWDDNKYIYLGKGAFHIDKDILLDQDEDEFYFEDIFPLWNFELYEGPNLVTEIKSENISRDEFIHALNEIHDKLHSFKVLSNYYPQDKTDIKKLETDIMDLKKAVELLQVGYRYLMFSA